MNHPEKLHVLLVEDSPLTAEQLCEMIRRHRPDVSCTIVATEADAVEKISATPIHAAVLDLRLKEGTGFGVLRKLASLDPKPFIVVLTNFALPKYRELALLAGADYFLDKATTMDVLPSLLDRYFAGAAQ
jgi:DNA-binding NarL/FixJ family response regulator